MKKSHPDSSGWPSVQEPLLTAGSLHAISGGGGNRTRVRASIHQRVYVRSPPIEVSSRWPVDGPLLDESPRVSPTAGRRDRTLARFCDTYRAASGGLPGRQGA